VAEGANPLRELLLRGKVAYLFQRYSAERELSAILLCIPDGNQEVRDLSDMMTAWIDQTSSGIYPLKVDLRSDGVSLAAIRTPVINLVRTPEQPLTLSWTLVLHQPIAFRPDGVFTTTALEDELAPGGRLAGQTRALAELATTGSAPVDVAVSPVLLTQLARMRDGYTVTEPDGLRGNPALGRCARNLC